MLLITSKRYEGKQSLNRLYLLGFFLLVARAVPYVRTLFIHVSRFKMKAIFAFLSDTEQYKCSTSSVFKQANEFWRNSGK